MREFRSYTSSIPMKDKIISGLSYLTSGLVGFIWIIVSHVRRESLSSFTRYHIFQSIFVFILIYLVGIVLNILLGIVQIMPFIGPLTVNLAYFLKGHALILGYSIIDFSIIALAFYLAISAFLGKYAELPWISDNVRRMI